MPQNVVKFKKVDTRKGDMKKKLRKKNYDARKKTNQDVEYECVIFLVLL